MTDTPSSHPGPGKRMQSFLHPSGKQVYTASDPATAETLRRTLTETHGGNDAFDLFIRGSDEHLRAIEEAREHREQQREELRRTHTDAFAQFESVHNSLDALSAELDSLTNQGVALDANFSRYGYSAHIKTVEDSEGSGGGLSRTSTANSDRSERLTAEATPFFKKPTVRQYFHRGLIWRASDNTEVSSIELLIDLIYVGILDIIGEQAAKDPTGESLLHFAIVFILSYRLWMDITTTISWISINDIFQRFCILLYMCFLLGFTVNIQNAFEATYTELIAFYVGERLYTAVYFLVLAWWIPMVRGALCSFAIIMAIGSTFFIGSIHVEYPQQLVLIWIGIAVDLFGNGLFVPLTRSGPMLKNTFLSPLAKHFQFYPALSIEHRVERTNAFVTLVLGYLVLAVLYQSNSAAGISAFFGKALLGLILMFSFSFLYYEVDSSNLHVHAIRRHASAYFVWQQLHLLFVLGFVLASGAAKSLVVAHDSPNADVEGLSESYAEESRGEIDAGLRWYFCGGLGVALLCTAGIALSHNHRDFAGQRLKKSHRLALRCVAAIAIIVLPTAGDRLNSLDLMAVTTCLVAFTMLLEMWGCSDAGKPFWADRTACKYSAECKLRKSDMDAMRRGEFTGIEQLVERQRKGDHGEDWPDMA